MNPASTRETTPHFLDVHTVLDMRANVNVDPQSHLFLGNHLPLGR